MIILANKMYHGQYVKSYDIYHHCITEENGLRTDGQLLFSEVKGNGTVVNISLYGDSWTDEDYEGNEKSISDYLLEIVDMLKIAEPNLIKPIIKTKIKKLSDEELYED